MTRKIVLCLITIVFLSFSVTNNFRELVLEKLSNYSNKYPEKVYVHTDKPYYTIGEDIWYSAYLVNGINHKKTNKSKVVYVELINEEDSIVSKKQLYIENINAAGDFKIKKDWKPGNYTLRSYTNYMRNQETDYFFQKQIPIWNVTSTNNLDEITSVKTELEIGEPKEIQLKEKPDIQFYPESGYLISGLTSKIAIKAKDKLNRNISINGVIKDSENNSICTFKTFQFGLGIISLLPETNKTYHASVMVNGVEFVYPLPKALPKGYNLNIANNGLEINVKASTNNPSGLKNSYLIAHQRGSVIFEKIETRNTDSYLIKLNTKELLDGVVHFTLFNNEGKPVCERLVYVNNPEGSAFVNVTSKNLHPATREKVNLNINLKNKNGTPLAGNLSLSVTDISASEHNSKSENIKTYLLLNSDLRGHIDDPNYFFEKDNDPKRRYLLDLIMLTHGWRRFIWNELLYNTSESNNTFEPETGIYISGRTVSKRKKEQISATTRLTFIGNFPYQEKKQSNANGTFKYGPFVFNDTLPTILEARIQDFKKNETDDNRKVDIHIDKNYSPSPKISRESIVKPNIKDQTKISNFINQSQDIYKINEVFLKDARLLDEIVVTAKKKSEREKRDDELNDRTTYGYPSNRIDMKDLEHLENFSILQLLSRVPGVSATNDSIYIRNGGPASVYLDEMPVEMSDIIYMTGADVDFIDVLKGAEATAFPNSGNGVVVIHQKTGADFFAKNIKRKPGIIDFTSTGFYTAREFYAPDHLNGFEEASKQDIRTTLHWEPLIDLKKNLDSANISFFTSDVKSEYAIKIEGITETGIPVYHFSTFKVE